MIEKTNLKHIYNIIIDEFSENVLIMSLPSNAKLISFRIFGKQFDINVFASYTYVNKDRTFRASNPI